MPATSLTIVTAADFADGVADVGYEAADQSNTNDFANTGKEILLVDNASGGNCLITFPSVPASKFTINDVLTKTPDATTIANGKVAMYGPFTTAIYGGTVTIGYSTDTSVTVAVVTMPDTPL